MPITLCPTVLATTPADFIARWKRITRAAHSVQVDLMDGKFVPTRSIPLSVVPDVRAHHGRAFEAHLMVADPERWTPTLLTKGYRRIIIHIETITPSTFRELAHEARKHKAMLIAAINPQTPIRRLGPYLRSAKGICVLGVKPGHNGAPYVTRTPERVRTIRLLCALAGRKRPVQVDGGMTPRTIGAVVRAGAVRINSGSYVGNAADPARALDDLTKAARAAGARSVVIS